jgi:hypothetical protein
MYETLYLQQQTITQIKKTFSLLFHAKFFETKMVGFYQGRGIGM